MSYPVFTGRRLHVALIVLVPLVGGAWLDLADKDVARGNRAWSNGEFRQALASYRVASGRQLSPEIALNIGLAYYRLAETAVGDERERLWTEAERALRSATAARDPELRGTALYNLGNALFSRGRFGEAAATYRQSLMSAPYNDHARHNLELAQQRRDKVGDGATGPPAKPPSSGDGGLADAGHADAGPGDAGRAADAGAPESDSGPEPAVDAGPDPGGSELRGAQIDEDQVIDEFSRKLDKLERRSRLLRRRRLRGREDAPGAQPGKVEW